MISCKDWDEKYSPQPTLLKYASHVADRHDLRQHIQLDTEVQKLSFDEVAGLWIVKTDAGQECLASFCICATGCSDHFSWLPFQVASRSQKSICRHTCVSLSLSLSVSLSISLAVSLSLSLSLFLCLCICIPVFIYVEREREREKERCVCLFV